MTKILLVEDDKSLREIYGVRLLAEGYDIVSAGDGEEALAMAIKDRPDLIVSDVMMPKISGFDMLDILRSTTETKNIKVIMMTALSSEEQRQRGVSLGADRYLVKSQVGIEDVVRTVHEVLADAPVTGQAPLVETPAATVPAAAPVVEAFTPPVFTPPPVTAAPPAPAAPVAPPVFEPVAAPAPVAPAAVPTPFSVPTPVATPPPAAPVATAPVAPAPVAPVAPAPVAAPVATNPTTLPPSVLPEPSAPFSTPRNTSNSIANRVIQPLEASDQTIPDFSNLIEQELGSPSASPDIPTDSGINFEETPLPAPQSAPAPVPASLPPVPPAPNIGL